MRSRMSQFERFTFAVILFFSLACAAHAQSGIGTIRSMGPFSGRVEGALQQVNSADILLKDGSVITGRLYVPGSPTVSQIGSSPNFGGTIIGSGSAAPTNYTVRIQANVALDKLVTRTDPIALETIDAPPLPTGTRSVVISSSTDSPGDYSTVRDLDLHVGVGTFAIPPGTYGVFSANRGASMSLGVPGATTPAVYNFEQLFLQDGSQLIINGPVIVSLRRGLNCDGALGNVAHPEWLQLKIFDGGLRIKEGITVAAFVTATATRSDVNVKGTLIGGLSCTQLTVDAGGVVRLTGNNLLPLVDLTSPKPGQSFTAPASILLEASASDSDGSVAKVEFYSGDVKLGEDSSAPYAFTWAGVAAGNYSLTARAIDDRGAQALSPDVSIVVTAAQNQPPFVQLTLPAPNSFYTSPAAIQLGATATDSDGTIKRAEFYRDGDFIGQLTAPSMLPSTYALVDSPVLAPGWHTYRARAIDNSDAATESNAVPVRVLAGLPYAVGFETSDGFVVGSLNGQLGWEVDAGFGQVTTIDVAQGTQAVALAASAVSSEINQEFGPGLSNPSIVFVDMRAKPAAGSAPESGTVVDADAARIGFAKNGATGQFSLLNGNGSGNGAWVPVGPPVVLTSSNEAQSWLRVTLRLDYAKRTWDFFLDEKLVGRDLAFRLSSDYFSWFGVKGNALAVSRLDSLSINTANPLFGDADQDGMPDSWEVQYGLDPTIDDRAGDKDGDGISNVDELINGTNPNTPPNPPEPDTDGDGLSDAQEDILGTNKVFPDHPDVQLQVFEPAKRTL